MKLSVIIVNYNVKYFLEQCLYSVKKAIKNIETEIIVVDNHSVDGSCTMIKEKFSEIILIENLVNYGFSKANNQAIKIAKGEYILLLNPDTVVEETTFEKAINFMDNNLQSGGMGVKMIDGKGNFLPESKRGLPTPMVALYKILGISRIFNKSKTFNRYHLGYLPIDNTNEIDVISGAFMMLRKSALDKTGLLDESFFMYGEDIDLSYRLIKSGYKNYYYPETTIIHYKGESTKKGSINYVKMFYNAMAIFAKKHFSKGNANSFIFFINIAIFLRAMVAVLSRFFINIITPLIDCFVIYFTFYFITKYWEQLKYNGGGEYPNVFLNYVVPSYTILMAFSIYYFGGYSRPVKIKNVLQGIGLGTIFTLVLYALLNESMRFSRAILLFGIIAIFILLPLIKFVLNFTKIRLFTLNKYKKKRITIVGEQPECIRVSELLNKTKLQFNIVGFVSVSSNNSDNKYIGNVSEINEIIQLNKLDEIIFCSKNIASSEVIKHMITLSAANIDYKIAGPDSIAIIGSNSINTAGELYEVHINSITTDLNKRNKRILDIFVAILFLSFIPILLFVVNNSLYFVKNIILVLLGLKTWVGYYNNENKILPKIKPGVVTPHLSKDNNTLQSDLIYAKDYTIINDLHYIFKKIKELGNTTTK